MITIIAKKRILLNSGHCCPVRPQSETNEDKKRDKYLDLTREIKKLWNMKVMVICKSEDESKPSGLHHC